MQLTDPKLGRNKSALRGEDLLPSWGLATCAKSNFTTSKMSMAFCRSRPSKSQSLAAPKWSHQICTEAWMATMFTQEKMVLKKPDSQKMKWHVLRVKGFSAFFILKDFWLSGAFSGELNKYPALTAASFLSKLTNRNLTFLFNKKKTSHLICSIQLFQQALQLQKRWCRRRNGNITSCLRILQPFLSCFQCSASISWTLPARSVSQWPSMTPCTSMATHMAAEKACAGSFLAHHGAAILGTWCPNSGRL